MVPPIPNRLSRTEVETFPVSFNTTIIDKQINEIQEIMQNSTVRADGITIAELQQKLEQMKLTTRQPADMSHSFIMLLLHSQF